MRCLLTRSQYPLTLKLTWPARLRRSLAENAPRIRNLIQSQLEPLKSLNWLNQQDDGERPRKENFHRRNLTSPMHQARLQFQPSLLEQRCHRKEHLLRLSISPSPLRAAAAPSWRDSYQSSDCGARNLAAKPSTESYELDPIWYGEWFERSTIEESWLLQQLLTRR